MSFDELHPRFWGLQKTFAYPPTIFEPTLLADFKIAFSATLTKFNGVPKVMSAPVVETKHGIKRKSEDPQRDEIANNFNPKYLTSRELFELEVSIFTCAEDQMNNHVAAERPILPAAYTGAGDDPSGISTVFHGESQEEDACTNAAKISVHTLRGGCTSNSSCLGCIFD